MLILKRTLAVLAILSLPLLIAFPAGLTDPISMGTASPRQVLAAQIMEALRAAEQAPLGEVPLAGALAAAGALVALVLWLALRPRPAPTAERAPRSKRAALALDLLRGGADPDEVVLRVRMSRDAIEVLRHTAIG